MAALALCGGAVTAFGFDDDSAELAKFERWLCLGCRAAGLVGDPACCAAPDHIPISPFVDGDRRTWWQARLDRRTPRERAAIDRAMYDRGRCYLMLHRHAKACGRVMVFAAAGVMVFAAAGDAG